MIDTKTLSQAIGVYSELLRLHQLNIELLNTLEQSLLYVQNFCKSHNIPFQDDKLCLSIAKVDSLLNEISYDISPNILCKPADEKKHPLRTDEDETEPATEQG